ncbi:FAD-dependent oxidoreductase [Alkalihalobacillus sp. CinArs1]|uniref:FAD-dependent oxidoreductase n=1 Tax=Alkalihalobacillus sp. CinArs1 TaxID=2995314 RepID=UPI0022DDFAA4|nr:FAD-dependent oxidoreductase [Alkalihalobacillus sp. CinArs1]
MDVCIVGGGIAGLTLAYWLSEKGDNVTVLEKSSSLRTEGYMIDFFGPGYEVAEKMGLMNELRNIHYPIDSLVFMKNDGEKKYDIPYPKLRKLMDDKHFNFMRGDLESVLYKQVKNRVNVKFDSSPVSIDQDDDHVYVTLTDESTLTSDLLVGADGMRSSVRSLAFNETFNNSIRYIGYYTAAYIIDDPAVLSKTGRSFYTYSEPGAQVSVYPIRGNKVATFFLYTYPEQQGHVTQERAFHQLHEQFGHMNWIVPDLLKASVDADDFYFDEVSQVELPEWRNGRITFVGDSCQCVSLLAGQGASMAMAGAYTLAKSLENQTDLSTALAHYEQSLHSDIEALQRSARKFANYFLPDSWWRIYVRDVLTRASVLPGIRKFVNFKTVRLPQ